jgi:hypothetical protein
MQMYISQYFLDSLLWVAHQESPLKIDKVDGTTSSTWAYISSAFTSVFGKDAPCLFNLDAIDPAPAFKFKKGEFDINTLFDLSLSCSKTKTNPVYEWAATFPTTMDFKLNIEMDKNLILKLKVDDIKISLSDKAKSSKEIGDLSWDIDTIDLTIEGLEAAAIAAINSAIPKDGIDIKKALGITTEIGIEDLTFSPEDGYLEMLITPDFTGILADNKPIFKAAQKASSHAQQLGSFL